MRKHLRALGALSLVMAIILSAGCGSQGTGPQGQSDPKKEKKGQVAKAGKDDTSEDGWWCNEHGMPEAECSMCSAEVEKACKAKGDWCEKHDRARSQCFKCEPGLKAKYDAMYRDHYKGKEPPPIKD
jgi:hypothetical protein